jgi:hypothetical protein
MRFRSETRLARYGHQPPPLRILALARTQANVTFA